MVDGIGPKAFAIHMDGRAKGAMDPRFPAIFTLGQTRRCVEPQWGEGGRFTSVTATHAIPRGPDPGCLEAWGYEADAPGSGFSIRLSAMEHLYSSGSMLLHMIFRDTWGWQQRESEELVGFTMHLLDRKLQLFNEWPPGGGWARIYGEWRHGIFFSCLNLTDKILSV